MKTKLMACFFALVMLMAFSTASMADQLNNGDLVKFGYGIGTTDGGIMKVYKYNAVTDKLSYLFDTFCLERNEFIGGAPYVITIDTYAIAGGRGGVLPGDPGDYISPETAFLYSSFRANNLAGFDATNVNDVDGLQRAFWYLENEYDSYVTPATIPYDTTKLAEYYVNLAENSGWTTIGDVRVLNPVATTGVNKGKPVQSVLILVPEPMTLLLLGFGLLGLGITRRKLKK